VSKFVVIKRQSRLITTNFDTPLPRQWGRGRGGGFQQQKTLALTGTRVEPISRYHPGSRNSRAPRYSDRQTPGLRTTCPGNGGLSRLSYWQNPVRSTRSDCSSGRIFSLHTAPARTGSGFADSFKQAYSFPSSLFRCSVGQNYATDHECGQQERGVNEWFTHNSVKMDNGR
jgi:hypothetical protein